MVQQFGTDIHLCSNFCFNAFRNPDPARRPLACSKCGTLSRDIDTAKTFYWETMNFCSDICVCKLTTKITKTAWSCRLILYFSFQVIFKWKLVPNVRVVKRKSRGPASANIAFDLGVTYANSAQLSALKLTRRTPEFVSIASWILKDWETLF